MSRLLVLLAASYLITVGQASLIRSLTAAGRSGHLQGAPTTREVMDNACNTNPKLAGQLEQFIFTQYMSKATAKKPNGFEKMLTWFTNFRASTPRGPTTCATYVAELCKGAVGERFGCDKEFAF